ncbi:hypothetical protein JFL43_19205 [Viridibacillus sp. YIM B01967]|uniref:Uncharacterized protein n=1 Tax=Viridibacillus soli TaxID=2798301 RepID=A0ABS1HCZ2_9BACL|nr:hypothetical protein [Viridibacillus soli]MBK3496947.1 hypothetical protein [Viridibacillus soli]
MQALEKRLKREVLQNGKVEILASSSWCVPVQSIDVTYQPVKRLKMDLLMKMTLLTFQQAEIANADELSELLLVEELFIQDLLRNLTGTGLIEKGEMYYHLTSKGMMQLENGIYEEEQEQETQQLLYSACHEVFLPVDIDQMDEYDELPDLFRYASEEPDGSLTFVEEELIEVLQNSREPEEEGEEQTVITEILSKETQQINDIPCLEFILYDRDKDLLFARVWNTLLSQWDDKLEKQLVEKEVVKWREYYLKA